MAEALLAGATEAGVLQDVAAEVSVLSAALLDAGVLGELVQRLRPEEFSRPAHAEIYRTLVEIYDAHEPVDLVSLTAALRRKGRLESSGGAEALADLVTAEPTPVHALHHAGIVRDLAILRDLVRVGRGIVADAGEGRGRAPEVLDRCERSILAVAERREVRPALPIADLLKETFDQLERQAGGEGRVTGVPSEYDDLDELTCGFQPAELVIIAGRPSVGKSTFALNLVEHAAVRQKKSIAFFSLEMRAQQVVQNLLCIHARIDGHKMRRGYLAESDWTKLSLAAGTLQEASVWIDDTPGLPVLQLRAKARRLKAQHGLDMIVVDYLQLMESGGGRSENRQQEIAEISRGLKALARELNVPVLALSQLNRAVEGRDGRKPQLSDLRESGAIEQDADLVMLLYREDYYHPDKNPGVVEVNVAKQRNGPTGIVQLVFLRNHLRFENHPSDVPPAPEEAPF